MAKLVQKPITGDEPHHIFLYIALITLWYRVAYPCMAEINLALSEWLYVLLHAISIHGEREESPLLVQLCTGPWAEFLLRVVAA